MSDMWKIKTKKVAISQDFSKSLKLYLYWEVFTNLKSFINKNKIDENIIIDKGIPKLWANSKKILWVWYASTFDKVWECKWGKVDAPQPRRGLSLINERDDLKMIILGEEL